MKYEELALGGEEGACKPLGILGPPKGEEMVDSGDYSTKQRKSGIVRM